MSGYKNSISDILGNVGIGTDSPSANFQVGDGTTSTSSRFYHNDNTYTQVNGYGLYLSRLSSYIRPVFDGTQDLYFGNSNATWKSIQFDATTFTFDNNGSEAMRIASGGNVGIGTDSPAMHLHINKDTSSMTQVGISNTSTGGARLYFDASNGDFAGDDYMSIGQEDDLSGVIDMASSGGSFHIKTGGLNRITTLQNGNVGIGTTSPRAALQVSKGISAAVPTPGDNTACAVFGNGTSNNNYGLVLGALGSGTSYISSQRTNGASTTYNLAIQPNGGNVGIGTTNPDAKLDIEGDFEAGYALKFTNTKGTGSVSGFRSHGVNGEVTSLYRNSTQMQGWNENGTSFFKGNVGIGTTSPAALLDVSSNNTPTIRITNTLQSSSNYTVGAFEFYSEDASNPGGARVLSSILCDNNQGSAVPNGELVFSTALGGGSGAVATERMRITSAGVVEAKAGFSATNGTAFVNVRDNTDGAILSSESNTKSIGLCSGTNYSAGSNFAYLKTIGGAIPLVVVVSNQNGVALTKNSTTWSSVSDETLKENIKPLGNVLDKIKDYQCVEYNLKTDDYEDKKIGFIAQDWENDFAPIISKDEDGILAMKYTETIPVLLKAIQELTAKVERLEAK